MTQKAKEIIFKAKKDVFSGNIGENISSFKGEGLDFKEIKEYAYPDDIKKINWNATAKNNELKINVFNESRQLNIIVAFMASGSLQFGSKILKLEVASEILALLGFSSVLNHNLLHPIIFSNQLEDYFEPTLNEEVVYKFIEDSLQIELINKEVDYQAFCEYINKVVKKKSIIFIIGDFYGDIDLSQIAYENDVYALIVRDKLEEYPFFKKEYQLVDPVNLSTTDINITKSVAKKYKKLLELQDTKLKEHFFKHGITSGKIYTDDDVYLKLLQIIKG